MSIILKHYEDEMVEDYERSNRKWVKRRTPDKKSSKKLSKE